MFSHYEFFVQLVFAPHFKQRNIPRYSYIKRQQQKNPGGIHKSNDPWTWLTCWIKELQNPFASDRWQTFWHESDTILPFLPRTHYKLSVASIILLYLLWIIEREINLFCVILFHYAHNVDLHVALVKNACWVDVGGNSFDCETSSYHIETQNNIYLKEPRDADTWVLIFQFTQRY